MSAEEVINATYECLKERGQSKIKNSHMSANIDSILDPGYNVHMDVIHLQRTP